MSSDIGQEDGWEIVPGVEAFEGITAAHVNSQVSHLLRIATALRGLHSDDPLVPAQGPWRAMRGVWIRRCRDALPIPAFDCP
jgi:hypothetical protein